MPLSTGRIFAGYRIVRLLGSGGMGEVFLGIGTHTDPGGPMQAPWTGFPWDLFD